jgi:hypothetical protein
MLHESDELVDLHQGPPIGMLHWHAIYDITKVPDDLKELVLAFSNQLMLEDDFQGLLPIPQEQIVILVGPGVAHIPLQEIDLPLEQLWSLVSQPSPRGRLVPNESTFEVPIRTALPGRSYAVPMAQLTEFYLNPIGLILTVRSYEIFYDLIPRELNSIIGMTLDGLIGPREAILDIVFFEQ